MPTPYTEESFNQLPLGKHVGKREMYIHLLGFNKRRPNHKGKHGIYRCIVTRPISLTETRLQALVKRFAVAVGVQQPSAPRHA